MGKLDRFFVSASFITSGLYPNTFQSPHPSLAAVLSVGAFVSVNEFHLSSFVIFFC